MVETLRTNSRRIVTWVLLLSLSAGIALAETGKYVWTRIESDQGIELFTSPAERHNYDVVRATAIIPAQASRVISALQAFERYTTWYHNAAEVRVLRLPTTIAAVGFADDGSITHVPNTGPWVLYIRQHAPPLEDRWAILRCELRAGPSGSVLIEFQSLRRAQPRHDGAVEMALHGYWMVRPRGRSRTEVTFMVDADPNTALPALFVDPELRNVVTQTLLNLQKHVTTKTAPGGRE